MDKVAFLTLGCKVNQYETQAIREQLLQAGFKEAGAKRRPEIYVINTCTVTQAADRDSLRLIKKTKRENPKAKIVVTGCLTEMDEDKIKEIGSGIISIKNKEKADILKHLLRSAGLKDEGGISYFKGHTRAFLKIQDGCNNFCSYCKVPLVRGISRSRPLLEIIQEARKLVKNGFKEIVLCAICLGAYGRDLKPKIALVDVISALENIEGLLRIRLSSIEAGDVSAQLINKIAQSRKFCRHLHIPMQSGDDGILKSMNRSYCRRDYLGLIKRIKKLIPDMAVTTDIMVGFPGEKEVNFDNTVDLVKKIIPARVHIFPYSPRIGTPAANFLKNEIEPAVIKERILRLKNIARECSVIYIKQFLGKSLPVLIEGRARENKACWEGYTDNYIKVRVEARPNIRNKLISLKLKKITKNHVLGVKA